MAAYLIDTAVPADEHGPGSPVPACGTPVQTGCVLAWIAVDRLDFVRAGRIRQRARVWDADGHLVGLGHREILCVNPLLGRQTDQPAEARANIGAANATGLEWGVRPGFMARQVGAAVQRGLPAGRPPAVGKPEAVGQLGGPPEGARLQPVLG